MPEGQIARQAKQDVEPQRKDSEDRELLEQIRIPAPTGPRMKGARSTATVNPASSSRSLLRLDALYMAQCSITPLRPIRPRGRINRTTTAIR